jgi:hypothetical protein
VLDTKDRQSTWSEGEAPHSVSWGTAAIKTCHHSKLLDQRKQAKLQQLQNEPSSSIKGREFE